MENSYSNNNRDFTIEPGCPWYEAQQSYGAPNVNWCEPTTCSYINEPANTWSNLPYMIIGLVLLKKMKDQPLRAFPYAVFFMGLFSFIYHASNNYLTQYLDFIGMFLMMGFMMAFELKRFKKFESYSFFGIYWFIVFLNTAYFTLCGILDWPVQYSMHMNFIPIVTLDLIAGYKEGQLKKYAYFGLAILSIAIAQTFAVLDIKRIWCEPENIILHGHVMWHFIAAAGMWFVGLHLQRVYKAK